MPGAVAIDIVEAAYRLDLQQKEWLHNILVTSRPALGDGFGVAGWMIDASNLRITPDDIVSVGDDRGDLVRRIISMHDAAPQTDLTEAYGIPKTYSPMSMYTGGNPAEVLDYFSEHATPGAVDYHTVRQMDLNGKGWMIGAPLSALAVIDEAREERWSRVMVHVMAGHRLRSALGANDPTDGAAAVLETDGTVAHAEGEAADADARDALRYAAKTIDRARGKLRRSDPDEALDVWLGLVTGQWSLVDHFDSDGRRYLVARRNDPDLPDPRALSLRERQVAGYAGLGRSSKYIAYTLGLSESAISTHLRSAMSKLGVTSRAELVQLFAGLHRQ